MNVGGPSKHVTNLTSDLRKYGIETLLLSGQPSKSEGEMFYLAKDKNIKLKIIPYMERFVSPIKDLISFFIILKEIYIYKPDIVHTHTTKAGILGRFAALICGVKHIYHTYHGHIFYGYFSKYISCFIIAIERLFSRFSTKLIALSPNLTIELKRIIKPVDYKKIVTVPLGLDLKKNLSTPRMLNRWRETMGFSHKDIIIGIVARLVPVKNHQMLINSMSELCKDFSNLHLAVIGNGELENQLKEQVNKLKLDSKIHFYGILKNLNEVYSDLNLIVLCSKNEGTPVVLIEALASGCPVASTNVGGVAEVLENGKLGTFLSSNPNEFTKGLHNIINDIANNNFKESLDYSERKKICNQYSVDKLGKNIYQLYTNNSKLLI